LRRISDFTSENARTKKDLGEEPNLNKERKISKK